MSEPRNQVVDVNHFDNKVVVKFEDGTIALLDGVQVRLEKDLGLVRGESSGLPLAACSVAPEQHCGDRGMEQE